MGQHLWETPRGAGDTSDSAQEDRRELEEETGALCLRLHDLGVVRPDSGLLETQVQLFVTHLGPTASFSAVDEVDVAQWVPFVEAPQMAQDGRSTDASPLAVLFLGHLSGLFASVVEIPQQATHLDASSRL